MKRFIVSLSLICVGFWMLNLATPVVFGAEGGGKLRVLVVTGGHEFETNQFLEVFRQNPGITFTHVNHTEAHAWLSAEKSKAWDVLFLYDMWQDISESAKADFVARLKEGKGLVVTHHAIANYQKWPEYERIIGAKYYLEKAVRDGVEKARSQWQHDVKFRLDIAASDHPVVKGLMDFDIHDETYNLFDVHPGSTILLRTDAPTSGPKLAWAKTYEAARVVYIQLGHDHFAFENPNYRRLIANAIAWTGKR